MTIGKNSRKSSVRTSIRAPKYLDKSSGFYGRLDEPGAREEVEARATEVEERRSGMEDGSKEEEVINSQSLRVVQVSVEDEMEKPEMLHFSEGMMEDDGETLLQRKPSRLSSRWRRSSWRKQKEGRGVEEPGRDERPSLSTECPADPDRPRGMIEVEMEKMKKTEEENEQTGSGKDPVIVHFAAREDEDDQVLIRDKKRGREEEGEEERSEMEQEEGMKMVKRNTVKNYRKALDRAFRRGWEALITNLYSVTLTPVTTPSPPPPSPSSKKKKQNKPVMAEFQQSWGETRITK